MMPKNEVSQEYLEKRTVHLPESGCWIWMLGTIKGGYGKISVGGKTLIAHRAVWEARNGPIPDGLVLCHTCDVPSCVNPDHLFLGTHYDNTQDMLKKGRSAKGEKIGNSKLNSQDVSKIRAAQGSFRSIAQSYGLNTGTVRNIKLGLTWRHVA